MMAATFSEYPGDASVLIFGNMNRFETKLAEHRVTLRRGKLQTLPINVGRKCNQTCTHCHVDAAPWRTEMMPENIAHRVGEWIREHRPPVVDITDRDKLHYRLLSDSDVAAAKAFGIAFKVDDATVEKYKGYGINLDAASGNDHHILPHPAVFVADTSGKIHFTHVNSDYKVRLEPKKILEAAQSASR